ncbi:MAG: histidine phosphatase family protein [Edaphobacter sp.]
MSEILFIRHAQTDMAGSFCGHSDPGLSALGRLQLVELTTRLRKEDIGMVYTSDLRRAYATGSAIAETLGIGCHVRPALREINFGQWEGLTWRLIEAKDRAYARRWIAEYPHLPAPDGEDFCNFEQRVLNEVAFLSGRAQASDRNIAVVSHAGVLRTVLRMHGCSDKEAWEQTRSYCSIIRQVCVATSYAQTAEKPS